jgi:hypothetical protein
VEKLQGHLGSMEANVAQVAGLSHALAKTASKLEETLFYHEEQAINRGNET